MRTIVQRWADELGGDAVRCCWYGPDKPGGQLRLFFVGERLAEKGARQVFNGYYADTTEGRSQAAKDWNDFKAGRLTVMQMRTQSGDRRGDCRREMV